MPDPSENPVLPTPPNEGVRVRVRRLLDGVWLDRPGVSLAWRAVLVDKTGERVHLAVAMACCVALSCPVSIMEIGVVAAAAVTVLRFGATWRLAAWAVLHPIVVGLVVWAVWQLLALAWSADPRTGLEDAGALRFALLLVGLWPLAHRRGWLLGAYLLGFVAGHLTQVGQMLGWDGIVLEVRGAVSDDRAAGWWGPVAGGTLLCAPLGMHLWACVHGTGRWRILAAGGATVTLGAIIATGTRGAWLAAAGLLVLAALLGLRRGRFGVRGVAVAIACGAVAVGGVYVAVGDRIEARVRDARLELAAADAGRMESNIGARLVMWETAWRAFVSSPIGGVGSGGFQAWGRADVKERSPEISPEVILAHAHGTAVHVAATGGVLGLMSLGLLVGVMLWWAGKPDPAA